MCFYRMSTCQCSNIPITVYKVMVKARSNMVNSVYFPRRFPYCEKDTITAAFPSVSKEVIDDTYSLYGTIVHAYKSLSRAQDAMWRIPRFTDWTYECLVIVKCKIPPGVEYWLGSDGEIGARELRIVSINN